MQGEHFDVCSTFWGPCPLSFEGARPGTALRGLSRGRAASGREPRRLRAQHGMRGGDPAQRGGSGAGGLVVVALVGRREPCNRGTRKGDRPLGLEHFTDLII